MNPVTRMKELIPRLREADTAYFNLDAPIISDREYDQLYSELKRLEQESGVILAASPTQRVPGEVLESLTAVTHTKPMLSADKTKSIHEIHKFLGGRKAVLSWKLDGLTLVLRYDGGRLVRAITRGDGLKGEDVTHNVRVMGNVPLTIPCTEPLEVRGECVIIWQNFRELNELEPSAHPPEPGGGQRSQAKRGGEPEAPPGVSGFRPDQRGPGRQHQVGKPAVPVPDGLYHRRIFHSG